MQLREMMTSGMHCGENQRRFLESQHSLLLDRDLYHNLVKKVKREQNWASSTVLATSILCWSGCSLSSRVAALWLVCALVMTDGSVEWCTCQLT